MPAALERPGDVALQSPSFGCAAKNSRLKPLLRQARDVAGSCRRPDLGAMRWVGHANLTWPTPRSAA